MVVGTIILAVPELNTLSCLHQFRMQITIPALDPSKAYYPHPAFVESLKIKYGTGNVKTAVTDLRDVGKFVARIIADERTLNRYVFCWTEEVTKNEVFALIKRVSGKDLEGPNVSAEELQEKIKNPKDSFEDAFGQYQYSIWIRGDNTVENAKKPEYGGALDARELYPDIGKELRSLEDYAKELLAV